VQELSCRSCAASPGVQASASNPASLGVRGFGKPFQFVIQSSSSYEELNAWPTSWWTGWRTNRGFADLDTDLRLNKPQIEVRIDRDRVPPMLGVDVSVIGRTLETLLGGRNVTAL
jgi:multidrug efflux pump